MTTEVTIDATYGGKPLEVLADLVAKREKYLKHETTENAMRATAINILSSIKARTKVADPKKAGEFGVGVMPAPGVVAGFKGISGTTKAKRVVREIGGHEMSGSKIVNLAGKYTKGESVLCFVVIFKSPKVAERFKGGYERVYVVARSAADVRSWASKKLSNYVKRYKGMAKWVIGQAQSQIHNTRIEDVDASARKTGLENLIVNVGGDGFSSGTFSIFVSDRLNYATLALRNGAADVELAYKKAANRTAAIIRNIAGYRLDEPIPTPFPEVSGK